FGPPGPARIAPPTTGSGLFRSLSGSTTKPVSTPCRSTTEARTTSSASPQPKRSPSSQHGAAPGGAARSSTSPPWGPGLRTATEPAASASVGSRRPLGTVEELGRGVHDRLFGGLGAGEFGGQTALAEDEDSIGNRQQLGQFARGHDDGHPLRGQATDQGV